MNPGLLQTFALNRYPDRTAIIFKDQRLTFRELNARSNKLGNALLSLGLKKGQKVAVLMNNCLELVESLSAIPKVGLATVPLNARQSGPEQAYILNDAEADALIVAENLFPVIEPVLPAVPRLQHIIMVGVGRGGLNYKDLVDQQSEILPEIEVEDDDIDRIHYTSGTTGKPKGVVGTFGITYDRLVTNLLNLDQPIGPDDVNLNIGPLTHAAGFMMSIYSIRGAANVVLDKFDIDQVLQTIEKEKVTAVLFIPTMMNMILMHPRLQAYDLSSLKRIWYGTAPMAPEKLKEGIRVFGNIFRQNYGLTEAPQPITYLGPEDHIIEGTEKEKRRLASAGKPALGVAVKIVKEDDTEIKPGEIGEITIQTRQLMKAYWKNPEATTEAFRGGWFHTGDMATIDEDGYIYIMDRKHDMIISGGFNIYPREVEDAIMTHPQVAEAAVIGVPDEVWGESVKAFVVTKPGARLAEEEIIQSCKKHLASYKKPKSVEFVPDLPKNAYGKVLRKVLKEPYWQGRQRRV
ncbi:MAG: long-chain fatty acid--CoA ligase [Deltaproteobacteria bacterium]|nr:long-chain fatty acid--CoA ligase [Deltaproteobacteria bacterium]